MNTKTIFMEVISQPKSNKVENVEAYFRTHDTKYVAEDAIFINMSSGEEVKGRDNIAGMLHYIYHVAFDAKAVISNTIVSEHNAVLESRFVGKHIGEFEGFAATGKDVNVPLCVTYDLNKEGLIQKARIYMLTDVMMQQLKHH